MKRPHLSIWNNRPLIYIVPWPMTIRYSEVPLEIEFDDGEVTWSLEGPDDEPESVADSDEVSATSTPAGKPPTSWEMVARKFKDYDLDDVEAQNQHIDTVLILAGLLASVVTSYITTASVQQQSTQSNSEWFDNLIGQISALSSKITSFSVNTGFINSTYEPGRRILRLNSSAGVEPNDNFDDTGEWMNVLFITSLIVTLFISILGVTAKEWYSVYLAGMPTDAREYCRVRRFRRNGLRSFWVAEITYALSALLIIAVFLFLFALVGYYVDTVATSRTIKYTTLIFCILWGVAAFVPIVASSSPWKLRILVPFYPWIQTQLRVIITSFNPDHAPSMRSTLRRLQSRIINFLKTEDDASISRNKDRYILLEADGLFYGLLDTVHACLDPDESPPALGALLRFIRRGHGRPGGQSPETKLRDGSFLLESLIESIRFEMDKSSGRNGYLGLDESKDLYKAFKILASSEHLDDWQPHLLDQVAERTKAYIGHPHHLKFPMNLGKYVAFMSGTRGRRWSRLIPQKLSTDELLGLQRGASFLLERHSDIRFDPLRLCHIILTSVGRAPHPLEDPLKERILEFTRTIARKINSLDSVRPNFEDTIVCHLVLDTALKMQHNPGIIDEAWFKAVKAISWDMFTSVVRAAGLRDRIGDISGTPSQQDMGNRIFPVRGDSTGGTGYEQTILHIREAGPPIVEGRWDAAQLRTHCQLRLLFMVLHASRDRSSLVMREWDIWTWTWKWHHAIGEVDDLIELSDI